MTENKRGRETPGGLCQEAFGFLTGALRVCDEEGIPERYCILTHVYLVCHAIELSCKAVLLRDGLKIKALRSRAFGHNLEALVNELARRNLLNGISRVEVDLVKQLSRDYHQRLYNYRQGGYRYKIPLFPLPVHVAKKFVDRAADFCNVAMDTEVSLPPNPYFPSSQ